MNLSSFKALVDGDTRRVESVSDQVNEESILAQIRDCFTPSESDRALSDIRKVITDLGVRYMCEEWACEPYLRVAEAVQWVLRERGRSEEAASDWAKAIAVAKIHTAMRTVSWTIGTRPVPSW